MAHTDLYGAAVFADSPLAWLRLDETSGTAAADESGNGHAGTHASVFAGQAPLLREPFGQSAVYAGVGQTTLDVLGTLGANIATASFEFIFQGTNTTGVQAVFGVVNTGTSMIAACYTNSRNQATNVGKTELHIRGGNGNQILADVSAAIYDGNPHHVVWVVTSGTTVACYVDGVAQTINYSSQQDISISPVNFGFAMTVGGRNVRGAVDRRLGGASAAAVSLDEVAFYSTRLSSTRAAAHSTAFHTAVLAGTSAGSSTSTGDLAAQRPLAGTSAGTSTTTGALAAQRPLAGTSDGSSVDTGGLAALLALAGLSAGSSTSAGDLAAMRPLAGTSAGSSSSTGGLAAVLTLAGTSAGASADTGGIAAVRPLAGSSAGASTDTGAVAAQRPLAGTSAGASTDTGALRGIFTLGGTSAGGSLDSGDLAGTAGPRPLAGTSAGGSSDTGGLSALRPLAGASAGSSSSTGDLAAVRGLAGVSAGASDDTGDLVAVLTLAGISAGGSADTGDLQTVGAHHPHPDAPGGLVRRPYGQGRVAGPTTGTLR